MEATEGWIKQRRRVRGLAGRIAAHRRKAAGLRRRMRARIAGFGEPRLVGWAFLVGLVWGSARPRARPSADGGRFLARLAGTLLWAWRFAHRVHATGAALGLDRGSAMNRPAGDVRSQTRSGRG